MTKPWDHLASGITAPAVTGVLPKPDVDLLLDHAQDPSEPFLCVDVTWGDGSVSYFGEIDRPTGDVQIVAKVLDVGAIRRAFAPDHSIQRSKTTLALENVSGFVGQKLRATGWAGLRVRFWIGFPELARSQWEAVAGVYRCDRAPEITPERVELDLIDDVTAATDQIVRLARVEDLALAGPSEATVSLLTPGVNNPVSPDNPTGKLWSSPCLRLIRNAPAITPFDKNAPRGEECRGFDGSVSNAVPIPYGPTFSKPPFVWARYKQERWGGTEIAHDPGVNPQAVIVLGASRDSGWMQPHWWAGREPGTNHWAYPTADVTIWVEHEGRLKPWLERNPKPPSLMFHGAHPINGVSVYIDVHPIAEDDDDPFGVADRATWYVAVLYVAFRSDLALNSLLWEYLKVWLGHLQRAAANGGVVVEFPGNAAAGAGRIDAARVVEHLLRYHTHGDPALIDEASFAEAATADSMRGSVCAGTIAEERPALEVVNAIARSHGLDVYYSRAGKVACHAQGFSAKDFAERIPNAERLLDHRDVVRGSFRVWQPTGDERNGYGTVFHIENLPEPWATWWPDLEKQAWDYADPADGYRRIDRTIDAAWLDPVMLGETERSIVDEWSRAYRRPRWMAGFTLSLRGMRLDLRDLLQLTHWAGPTDEGGRGWTDRLLRVEAVTLDWKRRALDFECLDAEWVRKLRPYILDDEEKWLRIRGSSPSIAAGLTAGSEWVDCFGFNPQTAGVVPGDILWVKGSIAAKVVSTTTAKVELDRPATTSETRFDFEFQASRLTTVRPWKYGALADEERVASDGTTGAYSDGTPGHQLVEG